MAGFVLIGGEGGGEDYVVTWIQGVAVKGFVCCRVVLLAVGRSGGAEGPGKLVGGLWFGAQQMAQSVWGQGKGRLSRG